MSGGAGGTGARTEDLRAAAALLNRCAADLLRAATVVGRVAADPAFVASAVVGPVSFARAEHALGASLGGGHGLAAAAGHVAALAERLALTALRYDAAEAGAAAAVRQVDAAVGGIVGRLLGVGLLAVAPDLVVGTAVAAALGAPPPSVDGPAFAGVVASGGDGVDRLVGAVPGLLGGLVSPAPLVGQTWGAVAGTGWPPDSMPEVSSLLLALAGAGGLLVDGSRVTSRAGPPAAATTAPRGVGDLARLVGAAYPDGGGSPGGVTVTRVEAPGRPRAWVVAVPGTEVWAPRAGGNPLDVTSDVRSMAGRESAAKAAVVAAMRSAGVRPGEPVCLVGHSLGGMVAADLAADERVRSSFAVRQVVTLGAPVGTYPVPPDVPVLSVEHTDDLVPRLDGATNPDRSSWLTVRRPVTPDGERPDVMATHDVHAYAATADLVDASADPSVKAARAGLRPFLDGPDVRATTVEVVSTRVPP